MECYIYDAHKTAFGVKGRHYNFKAMSLQELKDEADYISKACDEQLELEAKMEKEATERFEASVAEYQKMAGSRKDAIRCLLQAEGFEDERDPGSICYSLGLPYSMEKEFS